MSNESLQQNSENTGNHDSEVPLSTPEASSNQVNDIELAHIEAAAADAQATKAARARARIAQIDQTHQRKVDQRAQAFVALTESDPIGAVDLLMKGGAARAVGEAVVPKLGDITDQRYQRRRNNLSRRADMHDHLADEAAEDAKRNYLAAPKEHSD